MGKPAEEPRVEISTGAVSGATRRRGCDNIACTRQKLGVYSAPRAPRSLRKAHNTPPPLVLPCAAVTGFIFSAYLQMTRLTPDAVIASRVATHGEDVIDGLIVRAPNDGAL